MSVGERRDGAVPVLVQGDTRGAPVALDRVEAVRVAGTILWRALDPADWERVRTALRRTELQRIEDDADLEDAQP